MKSYRVMYIIFSVVLTYMFVSDNNLCYETTCFVIVGLETQGSRKISELNQIRHD